MSNLKFSDERPIGKGQQIQSELVSPRRNSFSTSTLNNTSPRSTESSPREKDNKSPRSPRSKRFFGLTLSPKRWGKGKTSPPNRYIPERQSSLSSLLETNNDESDVQPNQRMLKSSSNPETSKLREKLEILERNSNLSEVDLEKLYASGALSLSNSSISPPLTSRPELFKCDFCRGKLETQELLELETSRNVLYLLAIKCTCLPAKWFCSRMCHRSHFISLVTDVDRCQEYKFEEISPEMKVGKKTVFINRLEIPITWSESQYVHSVEELINIE